MIKCFDVATLVTDEATKQFGSLVFEDASKKAKLEEFCEILDDVLLRFDGMSMKVSVDDETTEITVAVICDSFEVDDSKDKFHELFRRSNLVLLQADEDSDEMIQISFLMDGIWSRNEE